jgi:hypothetical protein
MQLGQEIRLVLPNSHRINRGNYVVKELAEACRANEVTDLVVLHETRGVPGTLPTHSSHHHHLLLSDLFQQLPKTRSSSPISRTAQPSSSPSIMYPSGMTYPPRAPAPSASSTHILSLNPSSLNWVRVSGLPHWPKLDSSWGKLHD